MGYKSVFEHKLGGKTVFLRADLNSSVVEGRVVISSRLREHSKTVYALSEEGAKVVVMSHQGRSKEPDQFIPLKRHADFIRKFTGKPVRFVTWNEDYAGAIRSMKAGDIVVLDNTRFQADEEQDRTPEEHAKDGFIRVLAPLGQLFVLDALSVAHRSHATVVGFKRYMPCLAGPVLYKELEALSKLSGNARGSRLVVLGGSKLSDSVEILKRMLESGMCSGACVGGLFGELFLKARGVDFGAKEKFFSERGFDKVIPAAKELLAKHGSKLVLPVDLAVEVPNGTAKPLGGEGSQSRANGSPKRKEIHVGELPSEYQTMDIGRDTTELFKQRIRSSSVVVFNGPMGVYEKTKFSIGTKKILEAIAFHRCFSILGGGDTERALSSFGLVPQDFSHVSLAGKALLEYLAGQKLPGLEVLERK